MDTLKTKRKFYIISGEASGDLHGAYLIRELKKQNPEAEFRCWGGDLMQAEGATIVKHYKDLAFMGFAEVVSNLRTILGNMKFCKTDILQYAPDAVIFIDYPGFNIPIAKFVHKQKITTFYYIAPQVWAWKKGRIKTLRKVIDRLFVILPFEKPFFKKNKMDVDFVGHPLLDEIADFRKKPQEESFREKYGLAAKPVVAVLPGSRKQEIKKMLPIMEQVAGMNPDYQFVIAGMNSLGNNFYANYLKTGIKIIYNDTYNLLKEAHAALVTSGTATLETALFNVPEVVCYKGSVISYTVAKNILKVKYISLVNLIMDKPVVLELIQHDMNTERVQQEFLQIVTEGAYRNQMLQNYADLRVLLGSEGASTKTAELITGFLDKK